MNRLRRVIPDHAVMVLVVTLGLTILAAMQLIDFRSGEVRLRFDPSVDRLLPDGDASREFYDRTRRLFGSDETLVVALVSDDVFSHDNLVRIVRLTRRIAEVPGVHHVLSLANAVNVRGVDDDLEIAPFMGGVPESPEAREELRREVLGNPIYAGNLVSSEGRSTALVVYFRGMTHQDYLESGIDERIEAIAEEERGDAQIWITGGPHVRAVSARILLSETLTIPLAMLAVLGCVLALSFRSVRGVVLPLLTISVAVIWTLGLATALGYELNAVTALVPALLTTLGLSYAVHVVSAYVDSGDHEAGDPDSSDEGDTQDSRTRMAAALSRVAMPVGITALTTVAGFASLCLSPLGAVREFGLLSVVGVCAATLASLTLTPAALSLLPVPKNHAPRRERAFSLDRFFEHVARFDVSNRTSIFAGSLVVFLIALAGISQLRVGTQEVSKFRPDAKVRVHFEAINEHLEGANLIYAVLETSSTDGFKDPENLREIESLQGWLQQQPEVGGTTSLVDYVKLLNRGFHANDPEYLAIPETKRITSQLLFFGGSDELDSFVDSRYRVASIRIRTRVADSDAVAELADRIEERFAELPGHIDATLTGTSIVLTRTLDSIIRGQAKSIAMAIGIIYLVLAGLFVSFRIGLIALIPNVLPIAFYFGALGWLGIRLDPATSLIAPMILGIAVDDTIHYFTRFIRDAKELGDERRATLSALRFVGRPVTYTSIALCLGFLMLNFSELRSNQALGSLAALALGFAWLTDFTLTPALCVRLRIATLWDVLRLDLGTNPQSTIELFRGMNATQARIVALMASLVKLPRGRRLFNAGEPGDALYVVIQGSLRSTIPHEDGTTELATHSRGGVLGEVGLYAERRIANAEVLEDARLLRLTQESINQLNRQHPKIASILFRNLNAFFAHQLMKVTRREVAHTESRSRKRSASLLDLDSKAQILDAAFFPPDAKPLRDQLHKGASAAHPPIRWRALEEEGCSERLEEVGIVGETFAALALIPLVEVAWADGRMDDEERRAVLAGARAVGIQADSPSHRILEMWLDRPPSRVLSEAWQEYIQAACEELSVEGRLRLEAAILGHARAVAEAAGGVLGFRTVSRSEERVLARLALAFKAP